MLVNWILILRRVLNFWNVFRIYILCLTKQTYEFLSLRIRSTTISLRGPNSFLVLFFLSPKCFISSERSKTRRKKKTSHCPQKFISSETIKVERFFRHTDQRFYYVTHNKFWPRYAIVRGYRRNMQMMTRWLNSIKLQC
jgi:hypothetical protein